LLAHPTVRNFSINDQLVRIHFVTKQIQRTVLATWEFEYEVLDTGVARIKNTHRPRALR
jgi:hypothetical protein